MKDIKEKAEELYTYYDNLLSRELQLNTLVKSSEITEFVKDCARKSCSEVITTLDEIKSQFKRHKIFVPDGVIDSQIQFWYAVRKEIESSELYND